MMLRKCFKCNRYLLKDFCSRCKQKTKVPHPPRFSFPDRYGKYRRMAKIKIKKVDLYGNHDKDF